MGPGHASCYDALIVGAGIAGCALARALARQGRSVLIIDRNLVEPDRIVRELFQPDGVEGLKRLGLDECLEGIEATPVKGYHLYWKGEEASFWFCPTVVTNAEGEPETKTCAGRSFHHGRLVAKLRDAIRGDPTTILLEATVHEVLRDSITGRVVGVGCSVDAGSSSHEVNERTKTYLPCLLPPRHRRFTVILPSSFSLVCALANCILFFGSTTQTSLC